MLGLDYSAGVIKGTTIRAAGYGFVIRYVDDPTRVNAAAPGKHITPAEYRDLIAAGVEVHLVFEVDTHDMEAGYQAGIRNAHRALGGARWIGAPTGDPIFFAADEHLTAAQVTTALTYLAGAATVLGPTGVGVYGFPELMAAAQGVGYRALWQCGHPPVAASPVNVWQRNTGAVVVGGISCDVNELRHPIPGASAPLHGSESNVALIEFPATALPTDVGGRRWQDTDPMLWPRSDEEKTALVHAVPGGWRGQGSIASTTAGWATGLTASKDPLGKAVVTFQDGPGPDGTIKPSAYVEYLRVFYFASNEHRPGDWQVSELFKDQRLVGNRSLPQVFLPNWCTFLVVRYAAPGGLFLGIEWEH